MFDLTGGVDKVVNAAGLGSVNQLRVALKQGGEVAVMGLFTQGDALDPMQIMAKAVSIRDVAVGSVADQRDLCAFIDARGIKPPTGARFTFDDARSQPCSRPRCSARSSSASSDAPRVVKP